MARLVLISESLARKDIQEEGDIVSVFDDKHEFSPDEIRLFNFVSVPETIDEIYNNNELDTEILDLLNDGEIVVWKDKQDGRLYKLKVKPSKSMLRYDSVDGKIKNKIRDKVENFEEEVTIVVTMVKKVK